MDWLCGILEKAMDTRDLKILANDFMSEPLAKGISDCEMIGEALFDAAEEIEHLKLVLSARGIDDRFGGRMALMLECAILNPNGFFEKACRLLDEYKAEWDKVNPSPPTFMGEPIPQERLERLRQAKAKRDEGEEAEAERAAMYGTFGGR
jgi:hypothetical protein